MSRTGEFLIGAERARVRPAGPTDARFLVPWIHEATREVTDFFLPRESAAFLHREFLSGRGWNGHVHFDVIEQSGTPVGVAAFDNAARHPVFQRGTRRNLFSFLSPWTAARALWRRRRVGSLFPPPPAGFLHLSVLAVAPQKRRQGVGSCFLRWRISEARQRGHAGLSVDVARPNTRALAFYQRLGFAPAAPRPGEEEPARVPGLPAFERLVLPF